jgi:hypothetical protein
MEPAPWDLEFHMGSNEENWKKKIFLRTSDGNQTLIALIIIWIHMMCKSRFTYITMMLHNKYGSMSTAGYCGHNWRVQNLDNRVCVVQCFRGPTFLTFNEKNLNKYSYNQEMKYNCVWCEIHCQKYILILYKSTWRAKLWIDRTWQIAFS